MKQRGRPKGSRNKLSLLKTNVPKHKSFFLKDGTMVRNLMDLAENLDEMSEDIFRHHVSEKKDDFVVWVKNIINDVELAEKLLKSKTKEIHSKIVLRHIVNKIR